MPIDLSSQPWPSNRAVLLVHGIGNAKPGDYTELRPRVEAALGPAAAETAIYQLYYDQVNDWFAAKTQLGDLLQTAITTLSDQIDDPALGATIAEVCGDLLWPVLNAESNRSCRTAWPPAMWSTNSASPSSATRSAASTPTRCCIMLT